MGVTLDADVLAARLRADPETSIKLRGLTTVLRLPLIDPVLDVEVENGTIVAVRVAAGEAAIQVEAPKEFWTGFFGDPKPGFESLTAGLSKGLRLAGADITTNAAYFGGVSRVLEVVRDLVVGPRTVALESGDIFKTTDNAVGRYIYVTVDGVESRIYYEESGTGSIPLLLQHTAGGDSRQYRHMLADPEFQKRFRLISYDLPYHGRSLPPVGLRWWEETYSPSKDYLMNWVVGIADALKLDRPLFMGCSVGGNLALDLAAHHKNRFRAFVALNGWYSTKLMAIRNNDQFRDPRYSSDHYASIMLGATSPFGPEPYRREVYWNYSSNARGVYAGDNDYFCFDHDLSKDGHLIDTAKTPVYLLVGEYDPAARNEEFGGPAAAKNIPGLIYQVMKGQSHFAPTDDPLGFRAAVLPVLDELLEGLAVADASGDRDMDAEDRSRGREGDDHFNAAPLSLSGSTDLA